MADWDRYLIIVHAGAAGPHRVIVDDELGEDGKRAVVELAIEVHVDLHCLRCDTDLAALEPDDVDLADVVSVVEVHELTCVPKQCGVVYGQRAGSSETELAVCTQPWPCSAHSEEDNDG